MQDPFRPEPSPQFVREVRIGLSLLLLMLGLFVYMVYFKLTGGGVRPNEYDRVPVANLVWPNDRASETDRKLERLLTTDVDKKLEAFRREFEQRRTSQSTKFTGNSNPPARNSTRFDVVRSRSVSNPSQSSPLDQNELRGSLVDHHTKAGNVDTPASLMDDGQNSKPITFAPSTAADKPLTLHQQFAAAKKHRVTVQPRARSSSGFQGRTRLPIQVTGNDLPSINWPTKKSAVPSGPLEPSLQAQASGSLDAPQPIETLPTKPLADQGDSAAESTTSSSGFVARHPQPTNSDFIDGESPVRSSSGLIERTPAIAQAKERSQPLRPVEGPVKVDPQLRNAAFTTEPFVNNALPTTALQTQEIATNPPQRTATESKRGLSGSDVPRDSNPSRLRTLIAGESLWSVAQQEYEDGRYFRALFAHNREQLESAKQSGHQLAGLTIHAPVRKELIRLWPTLCPRDETTDEIDDEQRRFYVTSKGDTLFEIARQRLGQAFLYLDIYEANQFRLPDGVTGSTPLPAGLRLVLPLH